jgi:hypothetical protein
MSEKFNRYLRNASSHDTKDTESRALDDCTSPINFRDHAVRDTCRLLQGMRESLLSLDADCIRSNQAHVDEIADAIYQLEDYYRNRYVVEQREKRRSVPVEGAVQVIKTPFVDPHESSSSYRLPKEVRDIGKGPVPCVHAGPIHLNSAQQDLAEAWPWAADITATILSPLRGALGLGQTRILLPSVLLVGPRGCGKTAFALSVLNALGLPTLSVGLQQDPKMIASASAFWGNSAPHPMLLHIASSRVANPGVVLNEVDKIPRSDNFGSAADDLLSLLEPSESATFYDGRLRTSIDLSHISYIGTANSIDQVPAPLLSRFTVLQMPRPRPEHLDVIIGYQRQALARAYGCDVLHIPLPDVHTTRYLERAIKRGASLRAIARMMRRFVAGAVENMSPQIH